MFKFFLIQVLFDKVKSDRMGSHPDWQDFLQSDDWVDEEMREPPSKDDLPAETYKMADLPRRVPSKHIISLEEFDDIKRSSQGAKIENDFKNVQMRV